jgi:hypothetical protein
LADKNSSFDFFEDGVNSWEREDIFDGDGIDISVVEDGVETAVLLFDVEDGCCIWGFQFMDETCSKLFMDVFVLVFFLSSGEQVDFTRDGRWCIRSESYLVVKWSVWR